MSRKPGDWWDEAWNPVTGCTPCSPACDNCWAQDMLRRYKTQDPRKILLHEDRLEKPLHWRKPRRVFVCNLGDLFHPDVPLWFIDKVFDVMWKCPQHTFYLLTKRLNKASFYEFNTFQNIGSNVWFGVTAWDGISFFDTNIEWGRISDQYKTFLSLEPLLGPIEFYNFLTSRKINWVIVGGETGPKARPVQSEWVRDIRDQCVEAGVPFWFKSWGAWTPNVKPGDDPHRLKYLLYGHEWHQRPEDK
jgi:protein gp37